jgi:hypothetical protein
MQEQPNKNGSNTERMTGVSCEGDSHSKNADLLMW